MDTEARDLKKALRKLEREAKLLLRKMDRIELQWNALKTELVEKGHFVPQTLGDVLSYRQKKTLS